MQRSYLEYAMSVIVGRALPDVRDGLKPVQRRILFAMHELGLTPDRPYRKCARVVGDVLGKYHPHGDQAVYDALVRLVQTFASRFPILDGHGNFGSIDDDPPAAMRYTETRLAAIAHEALLSEIGDETVDFAQNFDGSQQEPTVLPAQLPFLLLNGCSGIAVGMATSIPPHNLNEIVDGMISLIKKPNLSEENLLKIIPGPDFPTGGEVLIGNGIRETYLKGRGSIPMRGIGHIEEIYPGKGKHRKNAFIVTELPYQTNKASWIEKLADLVNNGKISGISDIRDESDRDGMRIVVELRRDANAEDVINELQNKTSFLNNFGAILLALVNGQPKQLSLKQLLENFLNYREETLVRRTRYKLRKTEERLEIVNGLILALNNLKVVIELIQNAADAPTAKINLISKLKLNERQADAVLSMPLRRLTGLEQNSLRVECKELEINKDYLFSLLKDREKLLSELIKELKELKKKFGNKRRTKLIEGGDKLLAERAALQRPNTELLRKQALSSLPSDARLIIQSDKQVKIVSPQLIGRLHLNEECELGEETAPAEMILPIENKPKILAITSKGKVALVRWEFAGQQQGSIEKFLPGGLEGEKIISLVPLPKKSKLSLGMLSSDGRFKRLALEEVLDLSGRATTILKLKEGVSLISSMICETDGYVIIVSNFGRILKLPINEEALPLMGKLAQGPIAMKLFPTEKTIGAITVTQESDSSLILASRKGQLFKSELNSIRICQRGNMGQMLKSHLNTINNSNEIIDICASNQLIGLVTDSGRYGRVEGETLRYKELILKENENLSGLVPLFTTIQDK